MSQPKIVQEEIKVEETSFSAVCVRMQNALMIFLSEGESHLGTLAVSIPQRERLLGPPLSSILLGDRNTVVAKLLAERLAHESKKMALISVYLKSFDEKTAWPILLKLVEKTLRKEEKQ